MTPTRRTSTVSALAALLLCAQPALAAAAIPPDGIQTPASAACGAVEGLLAPVVGRAQARVEWSEPVCAGEGEEYACVVDYAFEMLVVGGVGVCGSIGSDEFGHGGEACTLGGFVRSGAPRVPVAYADIPAGGRDVEVVATVCFGSTTAWVPCTTWTVGRFHLPGEGAA